MKGQTSLDRFVSAGVFDAAEVALAATVDRLVGGVDPLVQLAVATAARATRMGHVGTVLLPPIDLTEEQVTSLWPAEADWTAVVESAATVVADVATSPVAADEVPLRPLVWDGRRLYLHRYWRHQRRVAEALAARGQDASQRRTTSSDTSIGERLDVLFPRPGTETPEQRDLQRDAVAAALAGRLAIIAGGPGTGKTRTIARLVAAIFSEATPRAAPPQVALAAPTGKAAARMAEAIVGEITVARADGTITAETAETMAAVEPTTIHRLIGAAPGRAPRFGIDEPLPHEWVIVDELSMVSLPLMRALLDAVHPAAGLVLVGDPDQLVSVEAGTVMADLIGPLRTADSGRGPLDGSVTVLRRQRRFAADSPVAGLADAIRAGEIDQVHAVLRAGEHIRWIHPDDHAAFEQLTSEVVANARLVVDAASARGPDAAQRALGALRSLSVLAAHRERPLGVIDWIRRIESALPSASVAGRIARWYAGRPAMVTANDHLNRVSNGDVGVVMAADDARMVAFAEGAGVRLVPASRLDRVETCWAMTIHKSQGSEVDHAVVSLPTRPSPIVTRELLYTAVTRARRRVSIVATEESLNAAVATPVQRASGLGELLWEF